MRKGPAFIRLYGVDAAEIVVSKIYTRPVLSAHQRQGTPVRSEHGVVFDEITGIDSKECGYPFHLCISDTYKRILYPAACSAPAAFKSTVHFTEGIISIRYEEGADAAVNSASALRIIAFISSALSLSRLKFLTSPMR